ncbi:MAG TPA: S9 family peptidase, partial [Gemmataceae bacterium]|nr:S9 family peptidase [Gemmataceae bacterium]
EVGDDPFTQKEAAQPTHIWLISADGGKARRLTSGSTTVASVPPPSAPASRLSWTPDGRSIAFAQQANAHSGDSDLVTVQLLDVAHQRTHALTGRKTLETYPTFSPDGSQVTYWYPRDSNPNNINEVWLAPASGGKGRCLTQALDRNLYLSEWMPDGKAVLVGGNDGTQVALWLQPLDGPARRLKLGAINASSLFAVDATVGKDGAIAFTGSEPHHPRELYYLKSPDDTPRRLTHFNDKIAALRLGKVETITWDGPDGFSENGILVYPPDFSPNNKYPLVLVVHGGPQSASTTGWSSLAQLIAAHGYVVFQPNYRGSDNLGNRYQHAIIKDWGAGPGRDVMAGLAAVQKRGFVDAKRIAVTGWSYGGYMTGWLTSHYHVWKTAVAGAPFLDWLEDYNISDGNVQDRYGMGGSPWRDGLARAYREQSPITFASQIRTPMLIMCDTGDTRCPITQSYALYHALKDNGVRVKFIAYPVGGHFPGDPVRARDVFRRWVEWLDKDLR